MSLPGDLKQLLIHLNRRLQTLESEVGQLGPDTSVELLAEIETIRTEIAKWQPELDTLGQAEPVSPPQKSLIYATLEDTTVAIEAERQRLAALLQSNILAQLRLLLSQAHAFERTLPPNLAAQGAISMLIALARQILQQVQDVINNLQPTILKSAGLAQALEALANQAIRAHGLQITLAIEQMPDRLPHSIELALFRATQEAIEHALHQARASYLMIRLTYGDEELTLSLRNNGAIIRDTPLQRITHQRLEQLGGIISIFIDSLGEVEVSITFTIKAPPQLTSREMDVLQLLAEGLSNKEIGWRLSISPGQSTSTWTIFIPNWQLTLAPKQ